MDLSPAASLRSRATIALGRAARAAARLRGGGSGGTALPGLVVERTDPGFLARTLGQLPHGVIVVSGTNGKTTTTKMVVQLLRDQGLRVLTNRSGSNFVRGVLASLLTEVDAGGRLDADIAVLELDEAHAVRFVELVRPRAALLLNVMRDQLDRFGEIDYTASLLRKVAAATTGVVVVNADDPRLAADHFLTGLTARTASFGAGEELRSLFLSDDDLRTGHAASQTPRPESCPEPRVRLDSIEDQRAVVTVDGQEHTIDFAIPGIHNMLNACAALSLCLEVLGDGADVPTLLTTLSEVEAAFGRGEVLELDGRRIQLALVKNPAGFRMSLLSAAAATADEVVMVAINDEYADGRDMSWLWDVDFSALRDGVAVVTGVRAWDMALRLRYEEVPVAAVEPDLGAALELLRAAAAEADGSAGRPMRVFTTYTAMLALRARLGQITDVEEAMA
ncbi:Mur ligase family protein [Actinomyces howellii]|uniref:Lipid II isoglutaminyl synthase (glutamine-hydrolyzing) subunit MurT n=1 Tax=Actinomyces howellii TaxID=52771 RepID=A0A3S4RGC9_9ACTO|nr:Mur ligase family protein [Actinomyces howellii]VEG29129.1 UDP-N-acetylmuramoyl-L-alanyl-D-glutamate synthetase [Actinomyces howellii]